MSPTALMSRTLRNGAAPIDTRWLFHFHNRRAVRDAKCRHGVCAFGAAFASIVSITVAQCDDIGPAPHPIKRPKDTRTMMIADQKLVLFVLRMGEGQFRRKIMQDVRSRVTRMGFRRRKLGQIIETGA